MTFVSKIITKHRTQLEGAGLLNRPGAAQLSPRLAAMRTSPRKALGALREQATRPSIQASPMQILFDHTLPAIEVTLIELGEERAEEIVGQLVGHGRALIAEQGKDRAGKHLEDLFLDLSKHESKLRDKNELDKLIEAYRKLNLEDSAEEYLRIMLGDKIAKLEVDEAGMITLEIQLADKEDFIILAKAQKHLQSLGLRGITDDRLEHLKALSNLQSLNLSFCNKITDVGLEHLKALSNLQSLNLKACERITDDGLKHLKALPSLQSLDLSRCERISDVGLEHLKALSSLQSLGLSSCKRISDVALEHLKALVNLQSLKLNACYEITDNGLQHLGTLSQLRSLDLSSCNRITANGWKHLKRLANLQSLILNGLDVTDQGLHHLKALTNLESLQFGGCDEMTDDGLNHLSALTKLRSLRLYGCRKLTGNGLRHLTGLTNLISLDLGSFFRITDGGGLGHLGALTNLQFLSLDNGFITNDDLGHLRALTNLQSLSLMGCDQITDTAVEELKAAIPGLEVRK